MLGVGAGKRGKAAKIFGTLVTLVPRRRERESLASVTEAYEAGSAESYDRALDGLAAERLPFEEYVRELAMLGLHDRTHTTDQYAAALEDRLRYRIKISILSNAEFAKESEDPAYSSEALGRLIFIPRTRDVSVEVPAGLSPWLHQFTIAHELGHLAAAHPPRKNGDRDEPADRDGTSSPRPRLARKPPLTSGLSPRVLEDLYEAETDLRAQYAIFTASLGPVAVRTSKLTQIG